MRSRAGAWLAWALAGLSVTIFVSGVALYVLANPAQEAHGSSTMSDAALLRIVVLNVPFLVFLLVGALISSRRPRNPVGWICLTVGLLSSVGFLSELYVSYGLARPGSVPFAAAVAALSQWSWILPVGLLSTYLLLLFPDGRLPSRRWRPLAWLSGAVIALLGVVNVLAPGRLASHEGVQNPFGIEGAPWLFDAAVILSLPLAACVLASAASLVLRYRRSGGEVRVQIKWIALAGSITGTLVFLSIIAGLLLLPESMSPEGIEGAPPLWLQLLMYALTLSFTGVPVAIGFAVLKYRLYDIDLIINRALVYAPLTAMLALVYFGGVVGLQAALRALSGQESTLAIVASTLAIAALFNPLRMRVQTFVDRYFYRRKYDAVKTLAAFNARLREETQLDPLSEDLVRVVTRTVQPAYASLWLRPEAGSKGEQAD